jgi:uncharacterized membrane protein
MERRMNSLAESSGRRPAAARRGVRLPRYGAMVVALILLALSVVLRLPTARYSGPLDQGTFNTFIFQHIGAYSDVTSLYFRDQLWNHPVPYFGYPLEYPVGMGALIWLIGFANSSVTVYLLATAAAMIVCGVLVVWLGQRFGGSNMWLWALSPTLPLYAVLNWDLFSIVITVGALLCFRRNKDGWGGVLLAAAVWTKFFPIVLVPLVLLDRVLQRRWRDTWRIGASFALASVAINAPFAIEFADGGVRLRESWVYFFRFNQNRPREVNLWNLLDPLQLSTAQINRANTVLLALGVAALMAMMWWSYHRAGHRPQDVLLAATLAAIAWFFLINKVYSPQYSLWLVALLALLAAPPALAVMFGAVDVGYFMASFVILYLSSTQNPATDWFFGNVLLRAMVVRELAIAAVIGWAVWRMTRAYRVPLSNEHTAEA